MAAQEFQDITLLTHKTDTFPHLDFAINLCKLRSKTYQNHLNITTLSYFSIQLENFLGTLAPKYSAAGYLSKLFISFHQQQGYYQCLYNCQKQYILFLFTRSNYS